MTNNNNDRIMTEDNKQDDPSFETLENRQASEEYPLLFDPMFLKGLIPEVNSLNNTFLYFIDKFIRLCSLESS